MTYDFRLYQDVEWHDGQALTAEDVKFTYEKILDPQIASGFNLPFQSVQNVQVPSPSTVVVTLKRPDPVFLVRPQQALSDALNSGHLPPLPLVFLALHRQGVRGPSPHGIALGLVAPQHRRVLGDGA